MPDDLAPSGPVAAVGAPRIRVSDADRAATVSRLQSALVEGRLDLDETEERVGAAFAARYDEDLQVLVADLPPHVPVPAGAPSWDALWVSAVWRARIVVLGAEVGGPAPTARQRGIAAALAVLALVWTLVCAFAGAAVVA
jgi:hypothetical protein